MTNATQREALSALMDGELPPDEAERLLDAMRQDPELRELWRQLHQVSGLLSGHSELVGEGRALADRVRESLEHEPVVLAPRQLQPKTSWTAGRQLALAASVALVAVVVALGLSGEEATAPQPGPVATAPSAVSPAVSPTPVVVAAGRPKTEAAPEPTLEPAASTRLTWNDARPGVEARLNGYLLNHNEYLSGGVRGMLPYARVVGYDPSN